MSSAAVPVEIIPGHRENDSGVVRKPFAFPPESLFVFTPERFSRSPRNPVRLAPESARNRSICLTNGFPVLEAKLTATLTANTNDSCVTRCTSWTRRGTESTAKIQGDTVWTALCGTQNPAHFTGRVGSSPTSGTILKADSRVFISSKTPSATGVTIRLL
jgi:hypothetical protein